MNVTGTVYQGPLELGGLDFGLEIHMELIYVEHFPHGHPDGVRPELNDISVGTWEQRQVQK